MELIRREMPKDYILCDTADWHVGSVNWHEEGCRALVKEIQESSNRFLVLKGDLVECISPSDKRYNLRSIDGRFKTVQDQAKAVADILRPISDRILGMCIGNHELAIINTFDVIRFICDDIKVHIDQKIYGAGIFKFIATHKGKIQHKMLFCHGRKMLPHGAKDPIQRVANQKAAQKRNLEELGMADCIYASQGHHHKLIVVDPVVENQLYLTDNGKKIKQKYRVKSKQNIEYIPPDSRWYAGTGSYRKQYCVPGSGAIDYAELLQTGPAELGYVEIVVRDGEVVNALEVPC